MVIQYRSHLSEHEAWLEAGDIMNQISSDFKSSNTTRKKRREFHLKIPDFTSHFNEPLIISITFIIVLFGLLIENIPTY